MNFKQLKETVERLEKVNRSYSEKILELEQENRQIAQGQGIVSQAVYDGLVKQLEREQALLKQYMSFYEQEKTKRNALLERFHHQQENTKTKLQSEQIATLEQENKQLKQHIADLQDKLSRKGKGKPRNNQTTNEQVYALRAKGKTIREICSVTKLSSTTITKVLKHAPCNGYLECVTYGR